MIGVNKTSIQPIKVVKFSSNEIDRNLNEYEELISENNIYEFDLGEDNIFILIDLSFFDNLIRSGLEIFNEKFRSDHFSGELKQNLSELNRIKSKKNDYYFYDIKFKTAEEYEELVKTVGENNYYYFKKCKFIFDETVNIPIKTTSYSPNIFWTKCELVNFKCTLPPSISTSDQKFFTSSFYDCDIKDFNYSLNQEMEPELKILQLQKNRINTIITNSPKVIMKNVIFKLFYNSNLTKEWDYSFESVEIKYSDRLLNTVIESSYRDYLNNFKVLKDCDGLYSQRFIIDKYINYFNSRSHPFYRLLFWFNGGYTKLLLPLLGVLSSLILMGLILYNNQEIYGNKNDMSLVPVFYPIDMFKNIILNTFSSQFSFIKSLLLLIEIVYIYSVFSLFTFIKRKFGFKKEI